MSVPSQGIKLSLIIPVHNGGESFRRCMEGVSSAVSPECEIIVVADGESDGSWKIADAFGARTFTLPESMGPARARNSGARVANGEILFFIDADVVVKPETVRKVLSSFEEAPEIAALFGSYDDAPAAGNFLSQYKNLLHHFVHQTSREDAATFWSGCGAIRRDVFRRMGGFDEGYHRPSIEDVELGYRLKRAGYRIRLVKEIQVTHLKRWGVGSLLRTDFFCRALPWTVLILREGELLNDLNLTVSSRISTMSVFLLFLGLAASIHFPVLLVFPVMFSIVLVFLNRELYRFFLKKRGVAFAVAALPWHWLYFLYSGLAFLIGYVRFRFGRIGVAG